MKISVDQPEAENVEAVYLNGRRLAMCVEADDEAGYAVVLLPPKQLAPDDPRFQKKVDGQPHILAVGDPFGDEDLQRVKLEGSVEIVLRKREGLDDSGLDK